MQSSHFAYSRRAWRAHLAIWVLYWVAMSLAGRIIKGRFQWLDLQDGWSLQFFLLVCLVGLDIVLPTIMHRRIARGIEVKPGWKVDAHSFVSPVPLHVWGLSAAFVLASIALQVGLPIRFQGYRGSLGKGLALVEGFAQASNGRIAVMGLGSLSDPKRGEIRLEALSPKGAVLWSRRMEGHFTDLTWSRDGAFLVLRNWDKKRLEVLDGASGASLRSLEGAAPDEFGWLPDGGLLFRNETGVLRWDPDGSTKLLLDSPCVDCLALSPDGERAWVQWHCGKGPHLALRDARSWTLLGEVDPPCAFQRMLPLPGSDLVLVELASDSSVRLWSQQEGRFLRELPGLKYLDRACLSPDGRWLGTYCGEELDMRLLDLRSLAWSRGIPEVGFGTPAAFSRDGREFWVAAFNSRYLPSWMGSGPLQRWRFAP